MINENKVLSDLKDLLGKEFTLPELATSYNYEFDEFAQFFFELDDIKKIDFSLTKNGGIRLIHVLGQRAKEEQIETEKYSFPKDVNLYRLIIYSLSLDQQLRIEFDKCMVDDSFVERFKNMSKNELKSFLKSRAQFFEAENKEELEKIQKEKNDLLRLEKNKKKSSKLTDEEKILVAEAQKKHQVGKKAVKVKTEIDIAQERKNRLEVERQRNYLKYGISETNKEQYLRLQKKQQLKEEAKIEEKKHTFKLRIESRKEFVGNYSEGEVLHGIITKVLHFGCFVDIGQSDGFINTSKLSDSDKKKFSKKLTRGTRIKCEIVNIDYVKKNIDLVPTTKNLTKSVKHQKNTTTSENKLKKSTAIDKEVIKEKREKERVDTVIDSILEAGGSDALKFFIRFIGKNIKENGNEWSISVPKNKKNTIRLNNNGLEGAYINDKGLMVVLLSPDGKSSADLKYLIERHVPVKDRQGKYIKVPKAVPLFLTFSQTQGKKKLLYSGYCEFFKEAVLTGTNKWKNAHSEYAIKQLTKLSSLELVQPDYIK